MKYLITIFLITLFLIISVSAQDDNSLEQRVLKLEKRVEDNSSHMEQIIIEFADELALLNVKFSTLEDKISPEAINKLDKLMLEFADELALLNVKFSTLEDSFYDLRETVDNFR